MPQGLLTSRPLPSFRACGTFRFRQRPPPDAIRADPRSFLPIDLGPASATRPGNEVQTPAILADGLASDCVLHQEASLSMFRMSHAPATAATSVPLTESSRSGEPRYSMDTHPFLSGRRTQCSGFSAVSRRKAFHACSTVSGGFL